MRLIATWRTNHFRNQCPPLSPRAAAENQTQLFNLIRFRITCQQEYFAEVRRLLGNSARISMPPKCLPPLDLWRPARHCWQKCVDFFDGNPVWRSLIDQLVIGFQVEQVWPMVAQEA